MGTYINGIKTKKQLRREIILDKAIKIIFGTVVGILFAAAMHEPAEASELKDKCYEWNTVNEVHAIADEIFFSKYKTEETEDGVILYYDIETNRNIQNKKAIQYLERIKSNIMINRC